MNDLSMKHPKEVIEDMGWQPIKTAPRDGSRILIWKNPWRYPVSAKWSEDINAPYDKWGENGWQDGAYVGWLISDCEEDYWYTEWEEKNAPTHWKPLPAPPIVSEDD